MENRIALIAGNGRFPILFAQEARKKGVSVIAIAIKEEASRELEGFVEVIYWLSAGELGKLFEILLKEKLTSVVMAGQVRHKLLFDSAVKLDTQMRQLLGSVKDKKTDSLIGAVARALEARNIKLLDSTIFLSEYLSDRGNLTNIELDERVLKDIEFGLDVARSLAGLDIGQSVVVKNRAVLAVESIEGTDETIKRAARYGKDGIVLIKVSKPNQDMRFDIPVIGPNTVTLLRDLKASCIAIEAKKTLIIDKEETIKLANESGIGIVAV